MLRINKSIDTQGKRPDVITTPDRLKKTHKYGMREKI
jgi:hypothetical protein